MSDQPVEHIEVKNKRRRRLLKSKVIVDDNYTDDSLQLLVKDEILETPDSPIDNNSLSNFDLKPLVNINNSFSFLYIYFRYIYIYYNVI